MVWQYQALWSKKVLFLFLEEWSTKDFQSCGEFFKDLHSHVIHRMIRLMEMSVDYIIWVQL